MAAETGKIIFVWDNFGPLHCDRCDATGDSLGNRQSVLGVQIFSKSDEYGWVEPRSLGPNMVTLFEKKEEFSTFRFVWRLLAIVRHEKAQHIFLCHYEQLFIFFAAILLRLSGKSVYMMVDSKFDDYTRYLWKEVVKSIFVLPYSGALAASTRSQDYVRFLGLKPETIKPGYDAVSVERLQRQCGDVVIPPFEERHLVVVARFIPKKNIQSAIRAFALAFGERRDRRLKLCGSGELEGELRALVAELGVADLVDFSGFIQSDAISKAVVTSLVLILPSWSEQFGQVVAEAQALSIPVICSLNCGARDELVRNGINGFLIEPDNIEGLAELMLRLGRERDTWERMSARAKDFAYLVDTGRFADSVKEFVTPRTAAVTS